MTTHSIEIQPSRGGGRIASPQYRQSLSYCDDFTGLEANVDRYELLLLVKRVGKAAGFTSRMIQLLDYYFAFTKESDWRQGCRPIVYQSLARTALDLGVSERQIQKLEKQLFEAGASTWNDSGNHKRYGQRDPQSGQLLYAYGVDLTPLAYLKAELEAKLQEKRLYDNAWLETKRQISWLRRQVRSMLLEQQREEGTLPEAWQTIDQGYEAIAVPIRTHLSLEALRRLLERHQQLHAKAASLLPSKALAPEATQVIADERITAKGSCRGEPAFAHYKYTTQEPTFKESTVSPADDCFQKSVAEASQPFDPLLASGMQHITLRHVVQAASERFRERLPQTSRPLNWSDVADAASRLRPELFISQASWAEACALLGRGGAAVAMLITDHAALRSNDPALRPAAYFRGMLNKARTGELRLHNTIFGLLERVDRHEAA